MQGVVAIVADIAVVDPKSRGLLTNAQVTTLAGTLSDYSGQAPGSSPRLPQLMWRKAGHSETFLERYVVQPRSRKRSRDRTGAVVSIMRPRRVMLRILRLRPAQSLRLLVGAMSAWRSQPRARNKEKRTRLMELPCPENKAWLPARPH